MLTTYRQIMDYFFVLTREEEVKKYRHDVKEILHTLGLLPFAGALLWVINEVFIGNNPTHSSLIANLEIELDEKRGKHLLAEIERGGNMGRGDNHTGKSSTHVVYFF